MKKDHEGIAARNSAINAYIVLVLSFIGLKTSFTKEVIDFLPIFLAVLLLILNNSIKYYNAVPCILALLLSFGLFAFLATSTFYQSMDEHWEFARFLIMTISCIPAIYGILGLIVFKLK